MILSHTFPIETHMLFATFKIPDLVSKKIFQKVHAIQLCHQLAKFLYVETFFHSNKPVQ